MLALVATAWKTVSRPGLDACATAAVRSLCLALLPALSGTAQEPLAASPVPARLAAHSLLLDAVDTPAGPVAVGERGIVLRLDPDGHTHLPCPVRSPLTGVAAVGTTGQTLVAVGHDHTFLRSTDAGASWTVIQHGKTPRTVGVGSNAFETPFAVLDVHFYDERDGLAVGTFGLVERSEDGGRTWQPARFDDPDDEASLLNYYELYDLSTTASGVTWCAANGAVFATEDRGRSWTLRSEEGEDSLFGIHAFDDGRTVVAVGIRGMILRTPDAGGTWERIDSGTTAILQSVVPGSGPDEIWCLGYGGAILHSLDRGRSFSDRSLKERVTIAAGLRGTESGHWLLTVHGPRGWPGDAP